MNKFPTIHTTQDIALIVPNHLVPRTDFLKQEIISHFMKDIPDFHKRLTVFGAFQGVQGKKATTAQIRSHLEPLNEELSTLGYQHIIVMDAGYFKVLTGKAFEKSIGTSSTSSVELLEGTQILPMVSPLVVRQRAAKLPLFRDAIKVIKEVVQGTFTETTPFKFEVYKEITDLKEMAECLAHCATFERLAYDIETTGLHHLRNDIITYALAVSQTEAYTFIVHPKYIGEENSIAAHNLFKEFLHSYTGTMIMHTVGFESKYLCSKYVMDSYNDYRGMSKFLANWKFEDVFLMAYALWNSTETIQLDLKELVKRKYGDYSADINVKDAINQPIDKLAYYNALDVSATLWLYDSLLTQLAPSQLEFYKTEMKNAQVALTKLMLIGIPVDKAKVQQANEELEATLLGVNKVFYNNAYVMKATRYLQQDMVEKYNSTHSRVQRCLEDFSDFRFNTNSAKQLQFLLYEVMGYTPTVFTPAKAPATSREVISNLLEETTEESAREVLECLKQYSAIRIILSTFIRALREDTIEVAPNVYRLFANYRVGGTQTFRPTSNNVNLLNMPAHGAMGNLIKGCFVAQSGQAIWASDYNSLQGFTGADLTKDKALLQIYGDSIDLHSYMLVRYWSHEFPSDHPETKEFYTWVQENYKELRQKSKAVTFALQFGAGASKIAKLLKVPKAEALRLYETYHNTYKGVAKFAEETLRFAEEHGYILIGHHGLRLQTPALTRDAKRRIQALRATFNAEQAQRTKDIQNGIPPKALSTSEEELNKAEAVMKGVERSAINAKTQYYDIVTLQALFAFQNRIYEAGRDAEVVPHATIYDAIYGEASRDPEVLQWVNDTLIECMTGYQYAPQQTLKLKANLDIGSAWSELQEVPNGCSREVIIEALDTKSN